MFLLRNHFSSFTFLLCLGNQINVVCLDWVLFWLSCCEARIIAGIHPNGEKLFFSPVFLTPLEATFLPLLFVPSSPFPSLIPITLLAKKHPMILLLPSAIHKEQPIAFILINIYIRLRQTRSNPVRLCCEGLICVCFSCRSCSPLFLWKTLNSPKLVKSGLNGSPAILLGDH